MNSSTTHVITTPVTTRPPLSNESPQGWRWVHLNEVARLESGHTPSRRRPEYWNGCIPWLSLKDIHELDGDYIYDTHDRPSQAGIDHSSARILPAGTVAFCRTASVGNAAILGREMATSQDFVNWVCGPDILPEFLLRALRTSSAFFDAEKQGTTHKTIYMPVVRRFQILLPPLPEQRRIAAILDKADAIRRKRRQAIQLTDKLLRSAFLDMFGDPVTNPKGWDVLPLADVGVVKGGLQVTSRRKGNPIEVPYLRVANVFRDSLDLAQVKTIRVTERELARATLKEGDLLIVEGHGNPAEIGRASAWDGSIEPCVHQNHLIRVRLNRALSEPRFMTAFLNSTGGRRQLTRFGKTTSGLNTISASNVKRTRVLCPPIQLQRGFSEIVDRIDRLNQKRRRVHSESDTLFNCLVHRAFSGSL